MASRIVNLLNSEKGHKLITSVLCTTCVGSAALFIIPNTILVHKYQSLFQMYKNSEPVEIEDDILNMFGDVLTDLKAKEICSPLAKATPFIAYGLDPVSAGCVNTYQGAVIGIPSTFSYRNINDVNENPIRVEGKVLDTELPNVEKLMSSIILSDAAKKYAICHEILSANTYQIYWQSILPPGIIISLNFLSYKVKKHFLHLNFQPPVIKGICYTALTLFGFSLWFFLKDYTSLYFEKQIQHQVCSLGQQYIQGGLEYYTKRLERNQALRELISRGSSIYTVTGNENIKFRNKTLPLTVKKNFYREKLDNLVNKSWSQIEV